LAAWLGIVAAGALALCWSLWQVLSLPLASAWPVVAALALVVVASHLTLKLPRSNFSIGIADVFSYLSLATLGPAVAVLAVGIEGFLGTRKTSKRMSSWISSPASAMAAMALASTVFEGLRWLAMGWGISLEVATLAGLLLASLLSYGTSMLLLIGMMTLKRGETIRWRDPLAWIGHAPWMLAVTLGSAFVAGMVHLNAVRFGGGVIAISVALVLGLAWLLRVSLQRQEAEREQQEALVSAARREAELSQQRFTAAFTHAAIGMAIVRASGSILQANQALCSLLGRTPQGLLGLPFTGLLYEGDAALLARHAQLARSTGENSFSMELRLAHASGHDLWVVLHCSPHIDLGGEADCLIYQLHDITSRHLAEARLQHIAFHDGLTDLANRNCFNERLEVAVERSRVDAARRFAVLFLDLDRFKIVNDSLGHMAGNELLKEVAQRLRACVRPHDLVARLGGDEFAVLLEDVGEAEAGLQLARRVLESLSLPLLINGTEVVPGASIGITFSDLGYRTVDEVLRDADLAMYEAKAGGRGRVALFDSSMHEKVAEKLALEADLRHAIGEGQLSVHFQPVYQLDPYRLHGFEALARWTHPTRGPINPAVFIGLAEESGHIEALTDWVIDQALAQLAPWRRLPRGEQLVVNVNISGRDLARADLAGQVQRALLRHGVPASALTLEITETTLMGRLDVALQTMASLRELGVSFSIDDFGTGYSSLAYLASLPIESLKIDRRFVMGLHQAAKNVEIVRAVLNLGQSLGHRVVAEGIETAEQLATLRELGVPYGQGYLLSRPLPAEQAQALLVLAPQRAPA
jgi:diguanylate cyclase (GGDEF)-like protein/PAS domain S-box-containing protein